jgi:two-component system, cell cycle response regulator
MQPVELRGGLSRQSILYPLAGAVLAACAPLGLLVVRRLALRDRTPAADAVRHDLATFVYVAASTLAFALLGRALGRSAERLTELSTTDDLTGLLNRRAFYPRLEDEIARSRRSGSPTTLVLIDLDRLKGLNDRLGHAAGDRALEKIARAIRREMRSIDVGARLGGDEFGMVAVGTGAQAAKVVAERLQTTIASQMTDDPGLSITASLGVVTFDPLRDRLDHVSDLTRAADRALYSAKRAGRNRVAFDELEAAAETR